MVFLKKREFKKRARSFRRKGSSISANVSGYGIKAGFKWGSKRNLASAVKAIVHKDLEVAHHGVYNSLAQIMTQATHYTSNLICDIPQGTSNSQRMGDEIYIDSIKLALRFDGSATNNTVLFRMLLVKSPKQFGASLGGAWTGAGLGSSSLYLFNPNDPTTQGIVDPKLVTIMLDETLAITPTIATGVVSRQQRYTLPIKQKFIYQTGQSYGKFNNWYIVVIPFQLGATAGVTNVATVTMSADVIFKNL